MSIFTLKRKFIPFAMATALFLFSAAEINAQTKPYQNIYSNNIQGDFEIVGNTVLGAFSGSASNPNFSSAMNSNTTGNNRDMKHIDLDGTTGNGAGTRNSTMARLDLPSGSTVTFAKLIWGGRANKRAGTFGSGWNSYTLYEAYDMNLAANRTIKFRKGTGAYIDIAATEVNILPGDEPNDFVYFQFSAPVTIAGNPNGEYWAANLPVSRGQYGGSGAFGGWSLVVVYTNPSLPYKSVRLYDGYQRVFNSGSPTATTINLSGLSIPAGASEARMGAVVWEGDGDLTGDYIKINGTTFSDALNPSNNPWNGTISKNGAVLPNTSRSPYLANQMAIDIDQINVSSFFPTGTTSASIELFTEADSYFPSLLAFSVKMTPPVLTLEKTGTTSIAPFDKLNPDELITYTLSGSNTGGSPLTNCFITDTIPNGLTYEPNTLVINTNSTGGFTGLQTDANDGDGAFKGTHLGKHYIKFSIGGPGNTLQPGDNYSVQFKTRTPLNANPLLTVYNTARIQGTSAGVDYFDDGTSIIGPGGATLAVNLKAFSVNKENEFALLKWTTAGEEKNDRFDIERSKDGLSFEKVGTVSGHGTTNDIKHYEFRDGIASASGVLYYRLSIVDTDGKITYSKIVALRLGGLTTLNNFAVYPNPFTSNVKMQINSARESKITVRISNAAGVQVASRNFTLQQGENIVVIKDLDALAPGLHMLEIISEDGKVTQKIMKR